MNLSLKGLRNSPSWKKNLTGFISLGDAELRDYQVRLIVEKGIEAGYETLYDISDEVARKWLIESVEGEQ